MSGSMTAKGSSPITSRAHQTACPRPWGAIWRMKLIWPGSGRSRRRSARISALPLASSDDEDEMLDAGRPRLLDDVGEDRPVDDIQQVLGRGLGPGQHPGSQP